MSISRFWRLAAVLLMIACAEAWADPAQDRQVAPNVPARAVRAGEQERTPLRPLSAAPEVLSARFRATVYELQGSRANTLAADILARKAATSESLFKALVGVANAQVLYQIDQPVNVLSEQIVVGSTEPVKLAASKGADPSVNGVAYINVGLILHLSAQLPARADSGAKPDASVQAQFSTLGRGQGVPISKSAAIVTAKFNQVEPLEFGQARVMLGTNSNPATALTQPFTYVVRYVFDDLHQSSSTALTSGSGTGSPSPATSPSGAEQQFPAQFEATAYEVKIPPERIKALDSEALAREAGTAEELLGRLAEIGEAKITYGLKQAVNVLSDQVTFSTNEWLTTRVRTESGPAGPKQFSTKTAQRVGFTVRFAGILPTNAAAGPNVTMQIQSSGPGQGGTLLAPDVKALRINVRSITHSEPLEFNQPRVMLSVVSPDPPAQPGGATLSVFRYLFKPSPEPRRP